MLLSLAIVNVWRRLSRSTLTLLAMGVAAAVLTAGLSLSQGIMRYAFYEYRTYYGGDILVFSPGFVGATPIEETSSARLESRLLHDSGFNPLLRLYPAFQTEGYLAALHWEYKPLPARLLEPDLDMGVVEVRPNLTMPAFVGEHRVELKRPPTDMRPYITAGTPPVFTLTDELKVTVNQYSGLNVRLGDAIEIRVPSFKLDKRGVPYADYSVPLKMYTATVVGKVAWPTREISWATDGAVFSEQGYVHSPEVYLTETAWRQIWFEQSSGQPYPALSASLKVKTVSELNSVVANLQRQYPSLTVLSVPTVARHVEAHNLLDKFYQAPQEFWQRSGDILPYAPREFGLVSSVLLYLNAGMLLASQMLANVASRRKELGILKALGARQREVVIMILLEALVLALVGATIGFGVVRLAAFHQAASNQVSWLKVLAATLRELLLVGGLTAAVSLIFGALPAFKVARMTVMDVFRGE